VRIELTKKRGLSENLRCGRCRKMSDHKRFYKCLITSSVEKIDLISLLRTWRLALSFSSTLILHRLVIKHFPPHLGGIREVAKSPPPLSSLCAERVQLRRGSRARTKGLEVLGLEGRRHAARPLRAAPCPCSSFFCFFN